MALTLSEIRERAETPLAGAEDLGRQLMRGWRSKFKRGYTAENAALAAGEFMRLEEGDQTKLLAYLRGFSSGMKREYTAPAETQTELTRAFGRGEMAGQLENTTYTLPG